MKVWLTDKYTFWTNILLDHVQIKYNFSSKTTPLKKSENQNLKENFIIFVILG